MDDQNKEPKPLSSEAAGNASLPPMPSVPTVPAEIEPSTSPLPPVPPSQFDEPVAPPTMAVPAKKPGKRKKITIIVLIILLFLVAGGAAAYKFWYQNPEKVISDGIVHALQAKTTTYTGSLDVATGAAKIKVALNGNYKTGAQDMNADVTISIGNIDYKVKASVLIDDKSDLFIKVANLDAITAPMRVSIPESAQGSFDDLVAKLNDRWIKISAEELATFNQDASKSQACINNVVQQTENHTSLQQEIEELYKKNKFVIVSEQLGDKDGSTGYVLSVDQAKAKVFVADLKNTEVYKTLHDCDDSFTISDTLFEKTSEEPTVRTEVWVSAFMHRITKVSFSTTSSDSDVTSKVEVNPTFNGDVTIETPEQSTTLKQLQADFETVQQKALEAELQAATGDV